jgi:hypothetical protein
MKKSKKKNKNGKENEDCRNNGNCFLIDTNEIQSKSKGKVEIT